MNIARARVFVIATALLPVLGVYGGRIALPFSILFGLSAIISQRELRLSKPVWICVGLITVFPLLSCMWALNPADSFGTWVKVAMLTILCGQVFCWVNYVSPEPITKISRWFISGIAIAAALLLIETVPWLAPASRIFLQDSYGIHFSLEYFNRGLGVLVLLVWPASLALYKDGRTKAAVLLPVMLLPLLSIFDSMSAGLALVAGVITYIAARYLSRTIGFIITYIVPVVLITMPLWLPISLDYIKTSGLHIPESAHHRSIIWHFASMRGMEHPLAGWGFDTSRIMPGSDIAPEFRRPQMPLHPHNMTLQIFLELGAIGLAAFAALWVIIGRFILKIEAVRQPAFWAAMAAWLVIAETGYGMWQYWWLATSWWLAAAFVYVERADS